MIRVVAVNTPDLGDRSYVVTDGAVAAVIDPQRDIDRVLEVVTRLGVRVTHVVETHMHNDYVSGGLELARTCSAQYVIPAGEEVAYAGEAVAVADGDALRTGQLELTALHTPGHTPHHLAWTARDDSRSDTIAVFTGGSLLFGSAGRTDLCGPDLTQALAREQWRSLHRLSRLEEEAAVYPTHGFGSLCSAGAASSRAESRVGEELARNPGLRLDEDAFVSWLVASMSEFPSYYRHMGSINRSGPRPVDLSPLPRADTGELAQRLQAGEWVVDVRPRHRFASQHVPGTINVELGPQLATQLGWTMPFGTPVTLLADTADAVAAAQRALVRIGIDRPAAQSIGTVADLAGPHGAESFPVATFVDVLMASPQDLVLDVRRRSEWCGGHLSRALHVPLHELPHRLSELPHDQRIWVHCAAGMRAAIAASLLAANGREVVLVDDSWAAARATGLEVVAEESVGEMRVRRTPLTRYRGWLR